MPRRPPVPGTNTLFTIFNDIPAGLHFHPLCGPAQGFPQHGCGIGDGDGLGAAHGGHQLFLENVYIVLIAYGVHGRILLFHYLCQQLQNAGDGLDGGHAGRALLRAGLGGDEHRLDARGLGALQVFHPVVNEGALLRGRPIFARASSYIRRSGLKQPSSKLKVKQSK